MVESRAACRNYRCALLQDIIEALTNKLSDVAVGPSDRDKPDVARDDARLSTSEDGLSNEFFGEHGYRVVC